MHPSSQRSGPNLAELIVQLCPIPVLQNAMDTVPPTSSTLDQLWVALHHAPTFFILFNLKFSSPSRFCGIFLFYTTLSTCAQDIRQFLLDKIYPKIYTATKQEVRCSFDINSCSSALWRTNCHFTTKFHICWCKPDSCSVLPEVPVGHHSFDLSN